VNGGIEKHNFSIIDISKKKTANKLVIINIDGKEISFMRLGVNRHD
jgi:hypothetical protein